MGGEQLRDILTFNLGSLCFWPPSLDSPQKPLSLKEETQILWERGLLRGSLAGGGGEGMVKERASKQRSSFLK